MSSLKENLDAIKEEYRIFCKGLDHETPISYETWLETELLYARSGSHKFLMTTAEVEKEFGLAVGTAKKAVQRGKLRAEKRGHNWMITRDDAIAYWKNHANTGE